MKKDKNYNKKKDIYFSGKMYPIGKKVLYPASFGGSKIDLRMEQEYQKNMSDEQLHIVILRNLTHLLSRLSFTPECFNERQKECLKEIDNWFNYLSYNHKVEEFYGVTTKPSRMPRKKLVGILNLIIEEFENII